MYLGKDEGLTFKMPKGLKGFTRFLLQLLAASNPKHIRNERTGAYKDWPRGRAPSRTGLSNDSKVDAVVDHAWGRLNLFCDPDNIYHSLEYLANDLTQLGRRREAAAVVARIDAAAEAALGLPACAKEGGAEELGLAGVETCADKYARWAYRAKARLPMEEAALSPLSRWGETWAAAAAEAGIDSAVPRRELGRRVHFAEDSYWSPLSDAGLIMAGTGARSVQYTNTRGQHCDPQLPLEKETHTTQNLES